VGHPKKTPKMGHGTKKGRRKHEKSYGPRCPQGNGRGTQEDHTHLPWGQLGSDWRGKGRNRKRTLAAKIFESQEILGKRSVFGTGTSSNRF